MDGAIALETSEVEPDLERRFRALVDSHRDRALRLAWRLVGGDEAAAEDVTQEAFVKAYRGLQRFRGEAALETWFYRILVRQAHSYRRWRAVREVYSGGAIDDPPDPFPSAPGDPALRRRIAAALDRLTRSQREAFVLVHLEGFRVRECAEVLGKPTGTVKSHLHRALAGLRRDLADLRDPPPTPDEEEPT
jgi:RNA polymerase sigma-70 factor (ECF subfamily)